MRPPVELHRPTILNIAAITCYCFAMLFHIIAYATDNWSIMMIEGVEWQLGLWHGCRQNGTEWQCTTEVFELSVFQTGSDWHLGSRVMMTIALILLFILEFVIIAYACIKNLERYRRRLVAITIALSVAAGTLTLATLALAGSKLMKVTGCKLEWSFGILLLSLVFQLLSGSIIVFDLYRSQLLGKSMRKSTDQFIHRRTSEDNVFAYTNTVVDLSLDDGAF